MNPGGRPTKYREEYAEQARKLCLLGYTDAQLADFFGVDESTINEWKLVHPEFSESIHAGKDAADADVAASLYHRALGYSHPAVKIFKSKDEDPVTVEYTEHYPPDYASASLWLRNRQPKLWRDKKEAELTGADGATIAPVLNVHVGTESPPSSETE